MRILPTGHIGKTSVTRLTGEFSLQLPIARRKRLPEKFFNWCNMLKAAGPRFIVGEVSKNWKNAQPLAGDPPLLCQKFEEMIARNLERGYILHNFQINRIIDDPSGTFNETIIAVFERI